VASGAVGPLFVSIGNAEMLNKFLELNPAVPRTQAFVDDYSFGAYKAVGIGSFEFGQPVKGDVKLAAPKIDGFGGWWKYLTNAGKLSPIEEGKSGFPEGVKRLGGTFVVKGDGVVYQWNDKVPGDQPNLEDVMKVVQDTSHHS
jgi:hypothetical protein